MGHNLMRKEIKNSIQQLKSSKVKELKTLQNASDLIETIENLSKTNKKECTKIKLAEVCNISNEKYDNFKIKGRYDHYRYDTRRR